MRVRRELCGVVLLLTSLCRASDFPHSKQLQWDGRKGASQDPLFPASYEAASERDARKLVFINNKAYDLSEEEQRRMRDLHLRKGYIPVADLPAGDDERAESYSRPVKASRFVADPDKKKLIVPVGEEELEQLKQEATTMQASAADRVVTESPVEASTVLYEYTQTSVLSYIWREFLNIGDLLGREVVDNMTNTLWYLWQSVVKFVQSRGRRSLPGPDL
ncbi:uncharacterized protein LOC125026428 [Penaeus chinensis]|uniref:uncharacterized protein LOC125026428 n=1 Tax=Penaeus chinensis TaxID=139456 RepID=UPI001FB7B3D7|nr:uncharacterized protein LOC125026428 [Penaeus chinensis]